MSTSELFKQVQNMLDKAIKEHDEARARHDVQLHQLQDALQAVAERFELGGEK